jgi:hypothetical protein
MKKILLHIFSLLFFLALGLNKSNAQTNLTPCSATFLPASGTVAARNPALTALATHYTVCGAGNDENPLWYKFTPKVDNFKISITASNCTAGTSSEKGVSATTFKQRATVCGDLSKVSSGMACTTIKDSESGSVTIPSAGKSYWLQIDGTDASRCDFTLTYNGAELNTQTATFKTQLFWDKSKDCNFDAAEKDFPFKEAYLLVKQGSTIVQTLRPDAQGKIESDIALGTYTLEVRFLSNLWKACAIKTLDLTLANQVAELMIPIQEAKSCTRLEGDLSVMNVAKNKIAVYRINYKNTGTATEPNAVASVQLDENQSIITASKKFAVKNNKVFFEPMSIEPLSEGYIELKIQNNNALISQRAVINKLSLLPSPLCDTPSPLWDKSDIAVFAVCKNDSVYIGVKNYGLSATTLNEGIIIEDVVIGKIKVPVINSNGQAKDSITVDRRPATNKTIRFELPQSPNNPRRSMPNVTVEGCKGTSTNPISVGFANMYPQDDAEPSIDIDIRETEVQPAFNDILGFPKGYGTAHYIPHNQGVEYMIRYKNNSIDPVQRLFIVDTLPLGFDVTTLQIGNCSHPHEWKISDNRVLIFALQNIVGGDSTYVKFNIEQQKDLPLGTVLAHRPVFYTEKEDNPTFANAIFHTVGKNFITVKTSETFVPNIVVSVFPNPSSDVAHISIENMEIQPLNLEIFDLSAKLLLSQKSDNNRFDLSINDLPKGFYFFRVSNAQQTLANGKLIKE